MTLLSITQFGGIAPAIRSRKLAEGMATVANNVRFETGGLTAWKGIAEETTVPVSTASIYKYNGSWLTSTNRRQFVGTILANDIRKRIYYTDANYPKIRSGLEEFKLGLPRPAAPGVAIQDAGDTSNITDIRNQRYVVAIVDAWGHEGPTSPATIGVEVGKDSVVRVDLTPCTIAGPYNLGAGALFRIYRTNSGTDNGYLQFVTEVPYGTAFFDDSVAPAELEELLVSRDWLAAPDDNTTLYPDGPLQSLVELPGVGLAGHSGNTVFFSEQNVPTAWPYYYASEEKVVAVAVIQGGLFVATEGKPYLLTGTHPASMVPVPIEKMQPCVSQDSMVDMGEFAIYASNKGLVAARGNSAELITGDYLNEEEWAKFQPSTIRAFQYDGKYIAFYGDTDNGTGFVFEPMGDNRHRLTTFTGLRVQCGYYESETDTLYLVYKDGVDWKIGRFNEGAPLQLEWQKEYYTPMPVGFSCIRVRAQQYPVHVEVAGDGITRVVYTADDDRVCRLPGGYRARDWRIKVMGQGPIDGVWLADSMSELP